MTHSENFNLNKQMNSINYSDGFKAALIILKDLKQLLYIPLLSKGKFMPLVIFLLWIFLSVVTQLTFVKGVNNNDTASDITDTKKSRTSTTLVFHDSSKDYSKDLAQKDVFIFGSLK